MKYLIALIFVSSSALAQTTQCVEVPKNHKIIFIPWIIPTAEVEWTWRHAKDVDECERELSTGGEPPCES